MATRRPPVLKRTREFFHDGSLARAADCQIADADDQTPERAFPKNSFAIKIKAQLHMLARR